MLGAMISAILLVSSPVEWWAASDLSECGCTHVYEWVGRVNQTSLSIVADAPARDPFGLGELPVPPALGSGHAVLFDGDDAMVAGGLFDEDSKEITVYAAIGWIGGGRGVLVDVGEGGLVIAPDDGLGEFAVCDPSHESTWGDSPGSGLTIVAVSLSACSQRVWIDGVEREAAKPGFDPRDLGGWIVVGAHATEPEGNGLVDFGAFRLGDLMIFDQAHGACEEAEVRAMLLARYE